jgi:transcriptional regulator with PAS, ATPase and Fis domain
MTLRDQQDPTSTRPLQEETPLSVRRFSLTFSSAAKGSGTFQSAGERCSIGAQESNDVVLVDPTVSRFHCEVRLEPGGARVRDLGSRNGTFVDGVRVVEAYLKNGSTLKLGRASLQVHLGSDRIALPASALTEMGPLVGASAAMRLVFAMLERAAQSDATVLLEGETGTGKEAASEAMHLAGARRDRPLVVVDCAALPPNLLESELFGHERGAFTGADRARAGAFEDAGGGTVLIDEVGELPLELQPKLLRVLERKEIRPLGSNQMRPVDVRMIAATNRDLRADVNQGRFRSDLYFRLAVVRITLPPLRARLEDLPLLVDRILSRLRAPESARAELTRPEFIAALSLSAWPGNVRELRNHIERSLVFQRALPVESDPRPAGDLEPYSEARRRALDGFERSYFEGLLARTEGNIARAAREAGIDRAYLYRVLRRQGLLRT